ncbi:flagellin N-terminal helical domain-containing protein [Proteiniclasticum ruminis]|uniref:flagellin N-terminal helical domain-containing protein n=1 Tax=Proteiniclasticum ruminis TaxID=398199 RepID=UPI0028ACD136|nr:flagellin [Proteiniclasticum ruminis]
MRINNNISAMNTYSRLTSAQGAQSKSLEKLSSGLRINRAGDDAAGLAISEKMRGQIKGLNQSVRNAQDGISLIQTAEGSLNETHSILNRMRELAVQSSNDTNTNADRKEIQNEMDQLATEITRISGNTEFNTQKLLNGTFEGKFHIGANKDQNMTLAVSDMSSKALGVAGTGGLIVSNTKSAATTPALADLAVSAGEKLTLEVLDTATTIGDAAGTQVANAKYLLKNEAGDIVGASADGKVFSIAADGEAGNASTVDFAGAGEVTFEGVVKGDVTVSANATTPANADFTADVALAEETDLASGSYKYVTAANRADSTVDVLVNTANNEIAAYIGANASEWKDAAGNVVLETSRNLVANEEFEINSASGINVSTQEAANTAIKTIDDAITAVSAERSKLGAVQNRLDHTINNLTTTSENLSAAESRIRDVDMAKEMMEFTKNNILNQASTAMLAQANQMPQGVLQLLG